MGDAGKAHRREREREGERADGARERGTENQAGARKRSGMGTAELAGKES